MERIVYLIGLAWGGAMLALVAVVSISNNFVIRSTAIEAGVAEYYLDENNERQFRFVKCQKEGE